MRRSLVPVSLAASLLALAAGARAEVDAEVPLSLKAKGTILPEGEVETFRFTAARGTRLSLKLAAVKKATLDFDLALLDGKGEPVEIDATTVTDLGSRIQVKSFEVPLSDDYALRVSAAGTGEYSLTLKGKAASAFQETFSQAPGVPMDFRLAAPAGSTVTLDARAGKGSAAVPRIQSIEGDGYSENLAARGKIGPNYHAVSAGPIPGGGDLLVVVRNDAGTGDVVVKAKVKPPKAAAAKMDVRGASLGLPAGGETLLARSVGAEGGTVAVPDGPSGLSGAEVVVPAGAVAGDVILTIADSESLDLGTKDDQAAGPAVALGPAGIEFASPVTVTLPYDPSLIPANGTADEIVVRVEEEDGSVREIAPDSVNQMAGTVTVQTTGFSVFQAVVPAGMPRLENTGWWLMAAQAGLSPDPAGNDSRYRWFDVEMGSIYLSDGIGTVDVQTWQTGLNPQATGGSPPLDPGRTFSSEPYSGAFTWAYGADGQTAVVTDESVTTLRVSRDGRVMVARNEDAQDHRGDLTVLLRKNASPLTLASLTGTYWFGVWDVGADGNTGSGAADLWALRMYGTVRFDGKGGSVMAGTAREAEYDSYAGTWNHNAVSIDMKPPYSIETGGTVLLDIRAGDPGQDAPVLRLYPGEGLDVMLGIESSPSTHQATILFLLRQPSGFSAKDLDTTWRGATLSMDMSQAWLPMPTGPSLAVPDFSLFNDWVDIAFDGTSSAAVALDGRGFARDEMVSGGLRTEIDSGSFGLPMTTTSNGKVVLTPPDGGKVTALFSAGGTAALLLSDPATADADYMIGLFVDPPPKKAP